MLKIDVWHAACCNGFNRKKNTRINGHPLMRREDGIVMNQVAAMAREEGIPVEEKKPFPQEKERAAGFSLRADELGLLDIVFLDAIVKKDAIYKR